jgi:hypothetical protein
VDWAEEAGTFSTKLSARGIRAASATVTHGALTTRGSATRTVTQSFTTGYTPGRDCDASHTFNYNLPENGGQDAGVLGDKTYRNFALTEASSPHLDLSQAARVFTFDAPRNIYRLVLYGTWSGDLFAGPGLGRYRLEYQDPNDLSWNRVFDSLEQASSQSVVGHFDGTHHYWREESPVPNVTAKKWRLSILTLGADDQWLDEVQLWGCGDLAVTTATPTFSPAPTCAVPVDFALPSEGAVAEAELNDGSLEELYSGQDEFSINFICLTR